MKKILFVVALLGFFVFSASAGFNANVFGGYTTVSMKIFNDNLQLSYDSMGTPPPGYVKKLTKLTQGFLVGGEVGYSPMPGLSIGPRVEYIGVLTGGVEATQASTGYYYKVQFTNYLLPIMVGSTYVVALPELPISVGGGVYMGYGIAGGGYKISVNTGTTNSAEISFGGGTFVTDLNLNANMDIGPVKGGLLLGYRIANVAEMKATKSNVDMGIKEGDLIQDPDGKAMAFDYSGFVVGLNFSMGF
ncbi:MAG: hypothetical protein WCJ46_07675 [bacterium]